MALLSKVSTCTIAFFVVVSFASGALALPNCTGKCETGYIACTDWCIAHNKTQKSRERCDIQCSNYWLDGKNRQSIGPADPSSVFLGPAKVAPLPNSNG